MLGAPPPARDEVGMDQKSQPSDSQDVTGTPAPREGHDALIARLEHLIGTGGSDPQLLPELLASLRGLQREADGLRLRYDSLFNAVPDPVSIISPEGRILDLNRAGERAYRLPREAIVGQLVHVINPDLPRDHMGPVMDALARDETYVVEVNNKRGDGTRFPVEVHSATFQDGPHRHVIAVARDLTRRREAELNYHALLVAIDKGVLFQGEDGHILSGNAAAFRILGIDDSQDIVAGLRWEDWLVIDHRGYPIGFREMPPMRALASGKIVESTLLGLYHHRRKQLTWPRRCRSSGPVPTGRTR
jgi:PAS domain S-box-containing protein